MCIIVIILYDNLLFSCIIYCAFLSMYIFIAPVEPSQALFIPLAIVKPLEECARAHPPTTH